MSIESNYYQPRTDKFWDTFVDECEANGKRPEDEDYEAWAEEYQEMLEEREGERQMEAAMEARFYPDSDY